MNRANRPTHSDHLRRSKRRRTSPVSSPTDDAINRLVPSRNQSPIAATTAALRDHIHPSQHESSSDEDNDAPSSQLLFTQPSFVSTQPSTTLSPLQSTVKYCKAPSSIASVKDLMPDDLSIIQDAVADLYPSISTIRDFQYEAIHQLAFNDDASLILIRLQMVLRNRSINSILPGRDLTYKFNALFSIASIHLYIHAYSISITPR
jgi:hypothetical protein